MKNNKKMYTYIILSLLLLLLLLYVVFNTNKLVNSYSDKAYPGQYLYDVDICGYEKYELERLIDDIIEHQESRKIILTNNEDEYEKNIIEFNIQASNKEKLLNNIMSYGKDDNYLKKSINLLGGFILNQNSSKNTIHTIEFEYDESEVEMYVDEIENEVNKDKIEPIVDISNDGYIDIVNGENGYKLNKEKLKEDIEKSIQSILKEDKVIYIDGEEIEYEIDEDLLEQIDTKISSYTTTYSTGTGRATNVEVGIERIDGTLLMPGESFSINKIVLPRTKENGYKGAPEYRNGKVVQGIGGGICQVSTTAYGAMLRAGILPTERYQHSMTVAYAPIGLDAAIFGDTADLKFTNTYEHPITINAYTSGGKATVEFWGDSELKNGITYVPKSYARTNLKADAYLYGYDSEGNQVYKHYLGSSTYKPHPKENE